MDHFGMDHSVQHCSSVAYLVKVMHGYATSVPIDKLCTEDGLIKISNDFHHILSVHDNDKDFEFITNALRICNLDECEKYRNTRN
eukprot:UN03266